MNIKKIQQINKIIESKKYIQKDIILDFLKDNELKHYFLSKLPKRFDDLQKIEFLLNELVKDERPFSVFNIFKESISENNNDFIIRFIQKYYNNLEKKSHDDLFQNQALSVINDISEKDNSVMDSIFVLIKSILKSRKNKYKEYKTKREYSEEKKLISELLKKVFLIYKEQKDNEKIKEIIELINKHFNLTGDDGSFGHYTPEEIFNILEDYINLNFNNNFQEIVNTVINQYSDEFKKFNGWELIGTTSDRHFVSFVLEPVIRKYYNDSKNQKQAWDFILQNCISKIDAKTKNKVIKKSVSRNRPDFLNRAVIPIILERYKDKDEKISEEAFEILKEFILSKRGIPHKSDLIYQSIKNDSQISDDKKWKIIEVSTNKYGIPVNVFVEEIVSDLTKKGNSKAKKALKDWLKNPDYYKRFRFEINIIQSIRNIFDSDFKYAVSLFKDFINSDYFINKQGHFESYKVAELFYDIIERDFKRGLKIIKELSKQKTLTKNQQIVLCYSLLNRGEGRTDNLKLLDKMYKKFIDSFLNSFNNDIKKISQKITFSQPREAFVQFAEKLAQNKEIEKALRIVSIFINDTDPYLPGKDPEDIKIEYNEHKKIEKGEEPHTITSVRGWCAWVLMRCAVPDGREDIDKIIKLTKQLTEDKNYYVQHMSCFALSQLARNRLSFINIDKKTLFLNDNTDKALEMAKNIEKIAFNLLRNISKKSNNIKKALTKSILTVFDRIRGLDEKDSLEFIRLIRKFPPESIAETAPLFIFFAEFRKNSFKDFRFKIPDLYDNLKPSKFDDKKFKKILKEVISKLEPKERVNFAINFEQIIRESDLKTVEGRKTFDIGYKYLDYLANEYDHELFEMIYMIIKDGMERHYKFNKWYDLYVDCLEKEKAFYDNNFNVNEKANMYWWPSMYNKYILSSVFEQNGQKKFLDAFGIIVSFPKEMEIYDSEIVSLLERVPKSNRDAKNIIKRLFERNPSKYYELQKKCFGKK